MRRTFTVLPLPPSLLLMTLLLLSFVPRSILSIKIQQQRHVHALKAAKQTLLTAANLAHTVRAGAPTTAAPASSASSVAYPTTKQVTSEQTCASVPLTLCVGSKEKKSIKMYTPDAKEKSLLGWYTFDDALGYDTASSQEESTDDSISRFVLPSTTQGKLKFGPGYGGVGSSLRFDGKGDDWVQIPAKSNMDDEMTVSFWMFLRNKPISTYNFILRKGSAAIEFTPTIQITKQRKLHVRLRQINDENAHGHSFQSFARVPWEKWTHVTLVLQGEIARMYVNGVRDNLIILNDRYRVNQEPWYLGGMPGKPGINAFIDDFKVHGEALEEGAIQAECQGALGSMSARNIKFLNGGTPQSCPKSAKCGDDFHVCTAYEQISGALQAANANGMFTHDINSKSVWENECHEEENKNEQLKLVLCCRNNSPKDAP